METKQEEANQNDPAANVAEQLKETKNPKKGIKYGIAVALLVITGFIIGWNSGVYTFFEYLLPFAKERIGIDWMSKYIKVSMKGYEEYEKAYKNDFVGGNTPEETIDLFIDALKKGDYELASKYFVIDEQGRWKKSFDNPNIENINDWIAELENNKNSWHKESVEDGRVEFWYNTGEGKNERTHSVYLKRNVNNKWKINHF